MTAGAGRSAKFWNIGYREARVQAILLACLSWAAAAVIEFGGHGGRDMFDHLRGADFIHFYTLGRIALTGQTAALYDAVTQHALQVSWVPTSDPDFFIPINVPQMALVFVPFAFARYGVATILWMGTTVIAYAAAVRAAWRPTRQMLGDSVFVTAAAAGFPPFVSLVLHGQTTTMPLVGFCLALCALQRERRFLAGMALSLVAFKPQLALALGAVVLFGGEVAMLAGIAAGVAIQLAAVWGFLGADVLWAYVHTVRESPQFAVLLEPRPYQLHSIRAVTNLFPAPWGTVTWAILSALVLWRTVATWRRHIPVTARMGVLVIASVLVSPHLTVYDAAVLAPAILWLGAWVQDDLPLEATSFWQGVFWLALTLLVPTAALVRVQLSVLILAWLFIRVTLLTTRK